MTDRQKIELIKRATEILDDDLTIEEHEFLYGRSWDDVPEEEKQLWYTAWREKPTTIEHAAYNTGCTPAEVAAAAKVVRAVRESWLDAGAARPKEFDIETPAGDLLALLERAAADLRKEAEKSFATISPPCWRMWCAWLITAVLRPEKEKSYLPWVWGWGMMERGYTHASDLGTG